MTYDDPNDLWEAYLEELAADGGRPSPQGAIAYAFAKLTATPDPVFLAAVTGLCSNPNLHAVVDTRGSIIYAAEVVGLAERIVDDIDARAKARAGGK